MRRSEGGAGHVCWNDFTLLLASHVVIPIQTLADDKNLDVSRRSLRLLPLKPANNKSVIINVLPQYPFVRYDVAV
jgi:hypothetical protein